MTIVEEFIPEISNELGIVSFDDRFTFDDAITIAGNQSVRTLQTRSPVDNRVWSLINDVVLADRDDIKLRIYGFADICDLSFLPLLPNVRKLSIDTIMESKSIESLSVLPNLHSLRLGAYDLKSYDFLAELGNQICDLTLERTTSKKPNLKFLREYKNLESLRICGHVNDIEVLGDLGSLKILSLTGVTIDNFCFIKPLQKLLSLNIDLVKCADFHSLKNLKIKSFGMSEIRNMEDISFISGFQSLQNLFLSDLNKVTLFPSLTSESKVRRIFIDNMKLLNSIKHVFECENLVDFIFRVERTPLLPDDFRPIVTLKKLRYASIGTGSVKKNKQIDELLKNANISRYRHYDFEYE